jgi:integrase/recombinase XerD
LIAPARPVPVQAGSEILERFAGWIRRHRGVTAHTLCRYRRALDVFVTELGEDPIAYDVASIRGFVIAQLGRRSRGETRSAVTAIRGFLRFLVAEGRVPPGIEDCVPTVPQWRLSSLPRYLEAPEVELVISSCDLTTRHGLRDRTVLLLLSRLGLRAGDIVAMLLDDIDWRHGVLRVRGKSHRVGSQLLWTLPSQNLSPPEFLPSHDLDQLPDPPPSCPSVMAETSEFLKHSDDEAIRRR